jgi:hypothetical protein
VTWNVNARRSGLDYEIRQSIMGHADRMKPARERYGFISDEELIAAIDKFTYEKVNPNSSCFEGPEIDLQNTFLLPFLEN